MLEDAKAAIGNEKKDMVHGLCSFLLYQVSDRSGVI